MFVRYEDSKHLSYSGASCFSCRNMIIVLMRKPLGVGPDQHVSDLMNWMKSDSELRAPKASFKRLFSKPMPGCG